MEEDKSKNCVNYPHEKYETYSDCEDDFVASNLPPGIVPIWFTNNTDEVTTSFHEENITNLPLYKMLHDGTQKSSCPLPCSILHVESRYLRVVDYKRPGITLIFSQDIVVTKTEFLSFTFEKFLSDVGGSMGLWLGLGLLQTLELFTNHICRVKKTSENIELDS